MQVLYTCLMVLQWDLQDLRSTLPVLFQESTIPPCLRGKPHHASQFVQLHHGCFMFVHVVQHLGFSSQDWSCFFLWIPWIRQRFSKPFLLVGYSKTTLQNSLQMVMFLDLTAELSLHQLAVSRLKRCVFFFWLMISCVDRSIQPLLRCLYITTIVFHLWNTCSGWDHLFFEFVVCNVWVMFCWNTLLGTDISRPKAVGKMSFLSHWWDMDSFPGTFCFCLDFGGWVNRVK